MRTTEVDIEFIQSICSTDSIICTYILHVHYTLLYVQIYVQFFYVFLYVQYHMYICFTHAYLYVECLAICITNCT